MADNATALLAAGCAVNVICGLVASAVYPTFPLRAKELTLSSWDTGSIIGCFSFSYMLACPMTGGLIAWTGSKPLTIAGLALTAVSTIVLGYGYSAATLYACRAIQGAGAAMAEVAVMALVTSRCPSESLGQVTARLELAQGLGWVLGPPAAGVLLDVLTFETTSLLGGSLVAAIALATARLLLDVPHRAGQAGSPGEADEAGGGGPHGWAYTHTLLRPSVFAIACSIFTFASAMGMMYSNLALHYADGPSQAS